MQKLTITLLLLGLFCLSGICQTADEKLTITTSSEKARALFIQARELKQNIEYAKADKLLNEAIKLDPKFALAHIWLYTPEGSKKALELIKAVTPGEALEIRGWDAYLKSDYKLAGACADSLAMLFPKDKSTLFDAGFMSYPLDKSRAMKYIDKVLEMDPNFAGAYNTKGYYLMETGKMDEAGKAFLKYIELQPKSSNAHDSYGDFLQKTGKNPEAIEEFRKAFENDRTSTGSMAKAAWIQIRNGKFDLARGIADELNSKATTNDDRLFALFLKSLVSYVQGDMKLAFSDLDAMKVKAIEVKNSWYILNEIGYKGYMLLESGDPAGAIKYFRQNLELVPSLGFDAANANLAKMYCHGYLSMALGFNKQTEEARKELDLAKKIFDSRTNSGQDINFMNLFQGALEINLKNYKKAIEYTEPRAIAALSVSNQYYTGLAYDLSGNSAKAIEYYTLANESTNATFPAFYLNKTAKRIKELKTSN